MLPFGIGFSEILLILVVLLLVVGPRKLPEIAKGAGKALRAVRRAGQELRDTLEVDDIRRQVYDVQRDVRQTARSALDIDAAPTGEHPSVPTSVSAALGLDDILASPKADGKADGELDGEVDGNKQAARSVDSAPEAEAKADPPVVDRADLDDQRA